jgi:hypothetical protein
MKKLNKKSLPLIAVALIALAGLITWVYLHELNSPPIAVTAICPTDYPDTEEGRIAYAEATDDWVKRYLESNPFASLEEIITARRESWAETGCNTASDEALCPTKETFPQLWNEWSHAFFDANPGAGAEEQINGWAALMTELGCSTWATPTDGETVTHATTTSTSSTIDYHEIELPE